MLGMFVLTFRFFDWMLGTWYSDWLASSTSNLQMVSSYLKIIKLDGWMLDVTQFYRADSANCELHTPENVCHVKHPG